MYANFHARKKPVPSSRPSPPLSPYVRNPCQAPTSLPGPSWLYMCEAVQPARPPFFRTAAASPTCSRKFSSSSSSFLHLPVAQIHYCMQCVTLRHVSSFFLLLKHATTLIFFFTFFYPISYLVKHLVWYAQSNSVLYAQEILLKKSHHSISNN